MAVYYSVKCPHCNHTVEHGKGGYSIDGRTHTHYGSPFRICPHCKNSYVDNNYIEPGLLDNKDFKRFNWGSILFVLIGAFFIYGGITEPHIFMLIVGILGLALGAFLLISGIKYKPEEDERLQREIKESKERLSDPHYVIALWKAECHLTPEILAWAKKAIAEEREKEK